jgi:hypothetical protein
MTDSTGGNQFNIFHNDSYSASTWRMSADVTYPFVDESGQPVDIVYTGVPYGFTLEGNSNPDASSLSLPYSQDFFKYFMQECFPGIKQDEFNADTASGSVGSYYKNLFSVLCRDFYDAFFRGRDDLGSNLQGKALDLSSWDPDNPTAVAGAVAQIKQVWDSLNDNEKQLAVVSYLRTRGSSVQSAQEGAFYLQNFSLRYNNILYWVARILVDMMGDMQQTTINAGKYTTRLTQTQQSISTEMTSSSYNYKAPASEKDYQTQILNQQNTKKLEDLRTYRSLFQKDTDKASSFLESSNTAVEQQSDTALEFVNKAEKMTRNIFKAQ